MTSKLKLANWFLSHCKSDRQTHTVSWAYWVSNFQKHLHKHEENFQDQLLWQYFIEPLTCWVSQCSTRPLTLLPCGDNVGWGRRWRLEVWLAEWQKNLSKDNGEWEREFWDLDLQPGSCLSTIKSKLRSSWFCWMNAVIKVKEGAWVNKWQEELPLNSSIVGDQTSLHSV